MKKLSLLFIYLVTFSTLSTATPLIDAVLKQDINSVKSLLKQGVDKNTKDNKGFNALDYAISRKYSEIAQLLYSDNLNNFIFLRQKDKPVYISFSKSGFKLQDYKLNNQVIVLGTITLESFKEVCQSYKKVEKQDKNLKKFGLFLVVTQISDLSNINIIDKKCQKFTTILYPNYEFYRLLSKLFKYQGVPEFLFRDKFGKLTGGSIESYIFKGNNGFTRSIR